MLLDQFHPPLSEPEWKGLHNQRAAVLAADVNSRLPQGWRAQSEVEFAVEIDVGVEDEEQPVEEMAASAASPWTPPEPPLTIPFLGPQDIVEVRFINRSYSPGLVGAIELVGPGKKGPAGSSPRIRFQMPCNTGRGSWVDCGRHRDRAAKELAPATHGTHHIRASRSNLRTGPSSELYAAAYRLTKSDAQSRLPVWDVPLSLGADLPVMPLF